MTKNSGNKTNNPQPVEIEMQPLRLGLFPVAIQQDQERKENNDEPMRRSYSSDESGEWQSNWKKKPVDSMPSLVRYAENLNNNQRSDDGSESEGTSADSSESGQRNSDEMFFDIDLDDNAPQTVGVKVVDRKKTAPLKNSNNVKKK